MVYLQLQVSESELNDEQIAILLQNEEFLVQLRKNEQFLSTLDKGTLSIVYVQYTLST